MRDAAERSRGTVALPNETRCSCEHGVGGRARSVLPWLRLWERIGVSSSLGMRQQTVPTDAFAVIDEYRWCLGVAIGTHTMFRLRNLGHVATQCPRGVDQCSRDDKEKNTNGVSVESGVSVKWEWSRGLCASKKNKTKETARAITLEPLAIEKKNLGGPKIFHSIGSQVAPERHH